MVEIAAETVLTDCEKKIIKQVEYYFGDANLARDKFLQQLITVEDGWVPMETMLKFNRLKQITEDCEIIVAALKKSTSGLMEVSEDGKKIRRSPEKPMPAFNKALMESLKERSVYAKGFPKDLQLDMAMEFFEKYGAVDSVYMRRDFKKEFKGSCFVTYSAKEGAEKFMTEEGTKYSDDTEFVKFYKEEYFKSKNKEKKNQSDQQKVEKAKADKESLKEKIISGAILCLSGIPKGIKRDEIKAAFGEHGKVEWVDIVEDQSVAKLRFSQTDEAKTVLEKVKNEEGKVFLKEEEVSATVLEGDEELSHWSEVFKSRAAHQSNKKGGNRSFGKRKGGRQGGPRNKKARGGDD